MNVMASLDEIKYLENKLIEIKPRKWITNFNWQTEGTHFVMKILSTSNHPMTAGEIAEAGRFTTARVAVLLKKMLKNELIIQDEYSSDRRIKLIKLTKKGYKEVEQLENEFKSKLSETIDKLGMEKIDMFLEILKEIGDVCGND